VSISATVITEVTPTDSAPSIAGLAAARLVFDAYKTSAALNSTSTPAITKKAMFVLTLSGGAATIDLTALADVAGTQDFTGLKVQAMKFQNPSANSMTLTKGASNGYGLLTSGATWTVPIPPALSGAPYGEVSLLLPEGTPDVGSGAKTIDVSGTGTQTLLCTIIAG
jgi:hypothetical protein